MKSYRLHLTTRCGCTRIIDHGHQSPPFEYTLALRPGRAERREIIAALNLAGPATEAGAPVPIHMDMTTRGFVRVSYSGTTDVGTAYYEEI